MAERNGFSIASVILSYLLVAGGVVLALVGEFAGKFDLGRYTIHMVMGAGAVVGGFLAARASRGSTILETAIGGGLVIVSLAALLYSTWFGGMIFALGQAKKGALIAAGLCAVGGGLGAFVGERLGESGKSSLPFLVYAAVAVLGGCFLTYLTVMALSARSLGGLLSAQRSVVGAQLLIGLGAGALVTGATCGALARTRILLASALGGAAGVFGFFFLVVRLFGNEMSGDNLRGSLVLAAGGGIVALVGSLVGWKTFGQRNAA
ncbi:MAG: hypothetical protein IT370_12935 [Deltaproteobacteria bacterium]|nr:hypothetical protein [Deltaproteobacteria bacterium]